MLGMLTVLAAFIAVVPSIYGTRINKRVYEMEKYRQTISLCQEFNDWYRYNNKADAELNTVKIWLDDVHNLDVTHSVRLLKEDWDGLDGTEKLNKLKNSAAMQRLLGYFEDAKMLHKKGLLDLDYFDNFFGNLVHKMERTKSPYVMSYIENLCNSSNREDIWDGYVYCRNYLITQDITAPCRGLVTDLKIRKGQMIEDTSVIISIRDCNGKSHELRPAWKGRVEEVLVEKDSVKANKILVKIRGCIP